MRILLLMLLGLSFGGCLSFSDRHFRTVRDSLTEQIPHIELEKEMAVSVGGMLFEVVDLVSDEVDYGSLEHLRVAVYRVWPRASEVEFGDVVFAYSLLADAPELNWQRIVRVRRSGEQVWVYAGLDTASARLAELSVFVLGDGELVMLSMAGELDDLLEHAMATARGPRGGYWRS